MIQKYCYSECRHRVFKSHWNLKVLSFHFDCLVLCWVSRGSRPIIGQMAIYYCLCTRNNLCKHFEFSFLYVHLKKINPFVVISPHGVSQSCFVGGTGCEIKVHGNKSLSKVNPAFVLLRDSNEAIDWSVKSKDFAGSFPKNFSLKSCLAGQAERVDNAIWFLREYFNSTGPFTSIAESAESLDAEGTVKGCEEIVKHESVWVFLWEFFEEVKLSWSLWRVLLMGKFWWSDCLDEQLIKF